MTEDDAYDTAKLFTPPPFERRQLSSPSPTPRKKRQTEDEEAAKHFRRSVQDIKASSRWRQRNASFEGNCSDSDSSMGSAAEGLIGAAIDIYWDQGAVGWYTAQVLSAKKVQRFSETSDDEDDEDDEGEDVAATTTLLSIRYDDGECDDAFLLKEWLWTVSHRSSLWLKEHHRNQNKKKKKKKKKKARAMVIDSDSDREEQEEQEEQEEHEQDHDDDDFTASGSDSDSSNNDDTPSSPSNIEDSGGVLGYDDALRYCDYEHDRRCDPLYADVGGRAFHVVNDRWRHAFHHIPNNDFARDVLRICSGPLLPGLKERRKRCKLCLGGNGNCRKHGRGGASRANENARCVMCNRRRNCIYVQLGALSENWVPLGPCCLRKLDSMIVLHKSLERIRALRDKPCIEHIASVRHAVDSFNRAVDEFDVAMGMDMHYQRYGQHGPGFYRDHSQGTKHEKRRKKARYI